MERIQNIMGRTEIADAMAVREVDGQERPQNGICMICRAPVEPFFLDRTIVGKAPRWFKPEQTCQNCSRNHQKKLREQIKLRSDKETIRRRLTFARVGKKFEKRTFDSFRPQKGQESALRVAKEYRTGPDGLYLHGHCGVGKTHLASAIANNLAKDIAFLFVSCPELLLKIRGSFNHDDRRVDLLDAAKQAPLLILDDIGSEKPSEWVRETLYCLIDYRAENEMPTIFTGNYSPYELAKRLGDRISSRIIGMCESIHVPGQDYRILKRKGFVRD